MQEIVFSVQNKNIKCVHSIQVEGVSMLRHICAFSVLRRVIMKLRKRGYVGTTSTEMSQREKDNAILASMVRERYAPSKVEPVPEMSITDIMSIFMTD